MESTTSSITPQIWRALFRGALHSLCILYTPIAQYLGFLNSGDEVKVMGGCTVRQTDVVDERGVGEKVVLGGLHLGRVFD